MNNIYKKNFEISYSRTNNKIKLSLQGKLNIYQDMTTKFLESFNCGNISLKKLNNAAWVVTKTKIHIITNPKLDDYIHGELYITKISGVRCILEAVFKNSKKEIMFMIKQEICPIDLDTRKIRKLSTINFPMDLEIKSEIFNVKFLKLKEELSKEDYSYENKIRYTDLDYSNHTNNVKYIEFILDSLNSSFFENKEIIDFEINYINESKENQILKIYKKIEEKENRVLFMIKEEERKIAIAQLKYK